MISSARGNDLAGPRGYPIEPPDSVCAQMRPPAIDGGSHFYLADDQGGVVVVGEPRPGTTRPAHSPISCHRVRFFHAAARRPSHRGRVGVMGGPEPRPGRSAWTRSGHFYPIELVRAITVTWLFSGLRSDEIARLRLGCIRWQHQDAPIPGDSDRVLARDAVCLLDVPPHKTGPDSPSRSTRSSARPSTPGRPPAPTSRLRRPPHQGAGELAVRLPGPPDLLLYINNTVIPMLCRKAGVPAADVRGNITSHRARSTMASQLYNAKEPMTLFELQAWLGHRSRSPPSTTPRSPRRR